MNKVNLIGNVGTVIFDNKKEDSGACYIFSLATSEKYNDKSNNEVVKTTWHKIVSFGKIAENLRKVAITGTRLFVDGKIHNERKEQPDKSFKDEFSIIVNQYIAGNSNL